MPRSGKLVSSKTPSLNKRQQASKPIPKSQRIKKTESKPEGDVKVRKNVRFRNITQGLRKIRKQQKSIELCMRKAPTLILIRQIAEQLQDQNRMRKATSHQIATVAEAQTIKLIKQALDRRIEAMTPSELKTQASVQVSSKHILGAFKVWCEEKNSKFMDYFQESLLQQRNERK